MDCSIPGFPVHHQFLEPAQTHFHQVGDAIQPSCPLSSPSPPAFNLSQHQGLFHESVLRIKWLKYKSFSFSISPSNEYSGLISFRIDSPCSPRDSQEFSPTPQFKSINSLALSFLYSPTLIFIKHLLLLYWLRQSLWLYGSQQTVENSSRDGNTRPPDLPPEKSVCRSRSNS